MTFRPLIVHRPPYPVDWYKSWESWYSQELIGKDVLPFRQQDWPNPYPVTWYKSLEVNLLQTTLKPPFQAPFYQTDWPNPQPVSWYKSQESSYNLNLIGQDKLPNRQQDWPLPYPTTWYNSLTQNLLQSTLFVTPAPPFSTSRNYDWPLPQPVTWYQFWSQSPAIPSPPPPSPGPSIGGRQVGWDEIERVERFSQAFLKDHNAPIPKFYNTNPFDPTIKARDAAVRLGRLGGLASGQARRK
jgi:hypothetical protein